VYREREKLRGGQVVENSKEYSFYVSSYTIEERTPKEMAQHIRDHWSACENGSHYRRDVTLGEDSSKIAGRGTAQAMATLRNLVIGLFELQKSKSKTDATYLPEWQRKMTATQALRLIKKGV
jgi:predicted transposase YbfD/YdcC